MEEKKSNQKILYEDIEYVVIENEKTKEIIAKLTQENIDVAKPFVIRIGFKKTKQNV